jgi:hypothetical protein
MPIGAIAGVTAVAGIGSAVIGSHAQKDAAQSAASTSAANTQSNNALAREMYATNAQHLGYWENLGRPAGEAIDELLFGAPPATQSTAPTYGNPSGGNPTAPNLQTGTDGIPGYFGPSMTEIAAMQHDGIKKNYQSALAAYNQAKQGAANHPATPATPATPSTPATPATPATPSNGHTPAANAFDNFRNSTNYQFRFGQGLDALDKGAAEKGSLDSGAARKAEMEYGQNFASNELSTYMDRLYQQETLGMSASSALAGVGQNLVGQVSANNNNGAAAAGNAALASGAATANMWNGVANSVGNAGGMILGGMNRSSIGPSALSGMNFANSPVNLSGPGLFY